MSAQSIPLTFEANLRNQIDIVEETDGSLTISSLGNDPWVRTTVLTQSYDPEQVYVISFDYASTGGLDNLQIFYGQLSAARRVDFGELPATNGERRTFKAFMKLEAPTWNEAYDRFRFDFGRFAGQSLNIDNLVLRAATDTEVIPLTLNVNERLGMSAVPQPDGNLTIGTLTGDPWIASELFTNTYDPNQTYVLEYRYAGDALDDFRVFFGEPWDPARMATFGPLPGAAATTKFTGFMSEGDVDWIAGPVEKLRFDFGRQAGKTVTVSDFYLREPTNAERNAFTPPVIVDEVCIELDVDFTSGGLDATEVEAGSYMLNTSGNDPWIRAKTVEELYEIDSTYIISFEYQAAEAYNTLEIFFGPPITGAQRITTEELPAAPEWTEYVLNPRLLVDNFLDQKWSEFRFDFGRQENVSKQISIRNIKLRKPTAAEKEAELTSDKFVSQAANEAFTTYLNTTFPDQVTAVKVDSNQVTVSGTVSGSGPYFLAEVEPQFYGFDKTEFDNVVSLTPTGGDFTVQQPRYVPLADRDYDRLYSRWVVVTPNGDGTYAFASAMSWATDITYAAENNLVEEKAETIKGLDGLTPGTFSNFQDLIDLDIKSMKINLLLNGVFALNANANTTPYTFNGKTYNINQGFVDNLDVRIKACTDAGIKTSLVLLIPIRFTNPVLDSIFTHPDASLGLYSMANVTSAVGVEHYTAMVDFLAKRYSRPDGLYGRMDQWIIHNEVDAHTSWTHAGQKPAPLYTQIYDRSMRMVHFTIRKHDPTAKVFSSFTKHFNSKVGGASGPNFRSKEILTVLNNLMKQESDYEWGIGWHSYPTNLRNPAVWNDAIGATPLNFNAAQITPRNLEMIDAYVRQESVLYNGKKVRTVLLSENGFSSNVNDNPSFTQERQAAAVAYFWKKTDQRLAAIENIQYHRWVDNPLEGNLEFGLWTVLPGTVQGFNEKKPSWYVWQAAGTPDEDSVFDPYKSVIGISDWSDIQFAVPTETTPYRVLMNLSNCDAQLGELLVSFNGEGKIPQEDGTVSFFNVASNVPQPYVISKNGVILASDTLFINEDTELQFDLQSIASISATGVSPTEIEVSWAEAAGASGYVLEVSTDGSGYAPLATLPAGTLSYDHSGVTAGQRYYYRVAADLGDGTLGCYSDPTSVIAPFIIVDYRPSDPGKPGDNHLRPTLQLRNESDQEVDIDRLTVRYWFTAEDFDALNYVCSFADFGTEAVSGAYVALDPARNGANYYAELSFNTPYAIPALGNSGDIRSRIFKADFTDFAEADDYSYAPNASLTETDKITVYWDGELVWGDEPAVSDEQGPQLSVLHENRDREENNSIEPHLRIVNDGNQGVDLDRVSVRYWFTPEGDAPLNYGIDFSELDETGISGTFVDAGALAGATRYFEVTFAAALGAIPAFSETGEMRFRFNKSDWSDFTEEDDYSFLPRGNGYFTNAEITVYVDGVLVWGTEPTAPQSLATDKDLTTGVQPADGYRLAPNPAANFTDLYWSEDIAATEELQLLDTRGARVNLITERMGTRLRLHFGHLPTGIYQLRGSVNGTTINRRLVIKN